MLARMSSAQFARWMAFRTIKPWGADVEDHRAGQICATVANYAGMRLKDGERQRAPADFFPSRIDPAGENEAETETPSVAEKLKAAFGGSSEGDA